MQIWVETGKSALPIYNYSQILYQFFTFTQNLKRSLSGILVGIFMNAINILYIEATGHLSNTLYPIAHKSCPIVFNKVFDK